MYRSGRRAEMTRGGGENLVWIQGSWRREEECISAPMPSLASALPSLLHYGAYDHELSLLSYRAACGQ